MDLEQFVEAKRGLEQQLADAIQSEIRKFEEATGRSPVFVDVDMEDVTEPGSPRRKFAVSAVRTDVPLE
jgi:hypothetical protein